MKKKFIEKLIGQAEVQDIPVADPKRRTAKTVLFADYAQDWLKLKEQTTKPSTFKEYSRMFEVNLRPTFGHLHLSEITRPLVQQYLFTFVAAGKYRTAEKLKLMLNCIFDMAAEDFNLPSPMKKIVLPYHESKKRERPYERGREKARRVLPKQERRCSERSACAALFRTAAERTADLKGH